MARVTVEDCGIFPNRFELVAVAVLIANRIASGAVVDIESSASEPIERPIHDALSKKEEKFSVRALREIANGKIDPARARVELIEYARGKHKALFVTAMEEGASRSLRLRHDRESLVDDLFTSVGAESPMVLEEDEEGMLVVSDEDELLDEELEEDVAAKPTKNAGKEEDLFSFQDDNMDVED